MNRKPDESYYTALFIQISAGTANIRQVRPAHDEGMP
jgi:hypothetical protein